MDTPLPPNLAALPARSLFARAAPYSVNTFVRSDPSFDDTNVSELARVRLAGSTSRTSPSVLSLTTSKRRRLLPLRAAR